MRLFRSLFALAVLSSATAWGAPPPTLYPDTLKLSIPAPATGVRAQVQLGYSVATDGNLTAIGAPFGDSNTENFGVVKIVDTATGTFLRLIRNPDPAVLTSDGFGYIVAISGGKLVVGGRIGGHVYVYDLTAPVTSGPLLSLTQTTNGSSGTTLAISGSRIIVGSPNASSGGIARIYDLSSPTPAEPVVTLPNPAPAEAGAFGWSVGISGTQAVVGATGSVFFDAGRAYTYDLAGPTPTVPTFTLLNPNPGPSDTFGYAVAISGNRVAVSAPQKSIGGDAFGAVMVYDLSGATPATPATTLPNPGGSQSGFFGAATAMAGTHLAVGAPFFGHGGGSVYAYELAGASPEVPIATLNNPRLATEDRFGYSVAVGTKVVVGAPLDDVRATDAGAAYLFEWPAGGPGTPIIFDQPYPALNDGFGFAMASSGTRVLISGPGTDTNDPALLAGNARLFDLASPTPGTPTVFFENPAPVQLDYFGWAVALSGRFAAISSHNSGKVYVYDLNSTTPNVPVRTLTDPAPGPGHSFGDAVALSSTALAVTAPGSSGTVYVYDISLSSAPILTVPRPAAAPQNSNTVYLALEGHRLVAAWSVTFFGDSAVSYAGVYDLAGATPTTPAVVLNVFGKITGVAIDGSRVALAESTETDVYQLDSATPGTPAFEILSGGCGGIRRHPRGSGGGVLSVRVLP